MRTSQPQDFVVQYEEALDMTRRLILVLAVVLMLTWETPRIWSHEPLDNTHLECASQIQNNRPRVEQAPPGVRITPGTGRLNLGG